ncbi:Protoporphyrinogen oxidase [Exidia glandulosa HHB12029]|uniref:Protoporphyrinogen oxidase n=1 Tax=Exidia glandulosa HHB12029 TaxID=1314781 RepID=A0A165MN96_EXIGL|nr:Protoporphyrinogen oxidase [Exidia glandulosa HHB12029]
MVAPGSIAVLGGGISGLSAALHLLRRFNSPLTLIEGSHRYGGWIDSHTETILGSPVILEGGPRTLRPSSALLELLVLTNALHLARPMAARSPAMRSRFVHFHGTDGLTALPSKALGALFSPFGRTAIRGTLKDLFTRRTPAKNSDSDESIESFLTRRVQEPDLVNMVSAVVHGIYAADARVLSARVFMGPAYEYGSPVQYVFAPPSTKAKFRPPPEKYPLIDGALVPKTPFSIRGGTGSLTSALHDTISRETRFRGVLRTHVTAIQRRADGIELTLRGEDGTVTRRTFSHVVSALPMPTLQAVLPPRLQAQPVLNQTPYTNVTVVNLVFPRQRTPLHPQGFGYLIPRPASGYTDNTGAGVLGVIFDSCVAPQEADDRVVRMTAMVGGPYYPHLPEPDLSTLLATIGRQLGRREPLPAPLFARAVQAHRCIPTPTVGHLARVKSLKEALQREFQAKLEIVGAAVTGVSVGDCIAGARKAGESWKLPKNEHPKP